MTYGKCRVCIELQAFRTPDVPGIWDRMPWDFSTWPKAMCRVGIWGVWNVLASVLGENSCLYSHQGVGHIVERVWAGVINIVTLGCLHVSARPVRVTVLLSGQIGIMTHPQSYQYFNNLQSFSEKWQWFVNGTVYNNSVYNSMKWLFFFTAVFLQALMHYRYLFRQC